MFLNKIVRNFGTTNRLNVNISNAIRSSQTTQSAKPNQPLGTQSKDGDQLNIAEKQGSRDDDLYRQLWVKCSGHEIGVLDSYEKFVRQVAQHLDIQYVTTESPHRIIKRKTQLANRFVKKKYRVQYETRTNFRYMQFKNLTGSTSDTFLEYIQRNLPEGVLMITEKHKLAALPFDLVSDQKPVGEVENKE